MVFFLLLVQHLTCFYSQKAHVQQFVATEDALNKAAEARTTCQKLLRRLHGGGDAISSQSIVVGSTSQNVGSLRQFEVILSWLPDLGSECFRRY